MKWFKHQSDASDDVFIENLEEIFGWEGYARWFKLLEKIAIKMDETDNCYAEHSWVKWQSFLKGKRNKLELFLTHCQDKGEIKLEQNGNILKIICPKLLELRDNHTKNLQVSNKSTGKSLATKIKSKDKDKEEDKEKDKEKNIDDFENFWNEYGKIGNKNQAMKAYNKAIKGIDYARIIEGVIRYQQYLAANSWCGIKHAATWLNNRCWDDDYSITRAPIANTWDAEAQRLAAKYDAETVEEWQRAQAIDVSP